MREMSVREANQNFSQVIAAAEHGETIIITKNGTPVARISPQPPDRASDPQWRAAFSALQKSLPPKNGTRYPVGPPPPGPHYCRPPTCCRFPLCPNPPLFPRFRPRHRNG